MFQKRAPPFLLAYALQTPPMFLILRDRAQSRWVAALFDQNGLWNVSQRCATNQNRPTDTQTLSIVWGHIDIQQYTDTVTQTYMELQDTGIPNLPYLGYSIITSSSTMI